MMSNAYAVIMAGGAGTRLWPLSREKRPKPLLSLVEKDRSMFQITVGRLLPLLPLERILVVAGAELAPLLQAQVPELPLKNYIIEPMGRDSAPAFGLGAIHVIHRDPNAVMAVLTADHFITNEPMFRQVLEVACKVAAEGQIVTLGIEPTFPSSAFGYVERGKLEQTVDGIAVYELLRFIEKPDFQTAEKLIASQMSSWNSGMFIWPVARVMEEFKTHTPDLHEGLERLSRSIDTPGYETLLAQLWPNIRRISIDFALMEKITQGVCVIPAEFGWSDIGNFEALYDILSGGDERHVVFGHEPILRDSQRVLVFSNRLVATIGVQDLVIIDTDDALLVCPRDRAQEVRHLVDTLKENKQNSYL